MGYSLGLKCAVCGSPITDDNHDGIGFGCRQHVVIPARTAAAKEIITDYALKVWIFKVSIYRKEFLRVFEGRKFRSAFKKSFFESIKNSERVSKKQLDVIKNMLEWEINLFEFEEEIKALEKDFCADLITEAEQDKRWKSIYNKYFEMFKKQYLSKKDK